MILSTAVIANEVRTFDGQKVVMFTKSTSTQVELIMGNGSITKDQQVERLKKVFQTETKYCAIAEKTFKKQLEAKCKKLLFGNYFAEDLVSQGYETTEIEDTRLTLSKYFTLLLLF